MARSSLLHAIRESLRAALRSDPSVAILGEDIGRLGGLFGVTAGFAEEFGEARILDLPWGEEALVETAIGMAQAGARPIVELQLADFAFSALEAVVRDLARARGSSGGRGCPVVIRIPFGGGVDGAAEFSESPEAHFVHVPGLKVAVPSGAETAPALLEAAIADDDPVVFLEPLALYHATSEQAGGGLHGLGRARIVRRGDHATLLCWGAMVPRALKAASSVASRGVEVEVIDLATLAPLDEETILESVRKTGRLVVAHDAPRRGGFAGELAALAAEKAILHLEAPILRVTGPDGLAGEAGDEPGPPASERVERALLEAARF